MENTTGTKRRRGPNLGSDVKRHNVTVVMTGPMRDAIRRVADANGRSVSAEIDFRLGMSLALEDDSGLPSTRRLIDFARLAASRLAERFGGDWRDNAFTAFSLSRAIDRYIHANTVKADWPEELETFTLEKQRVEKAFVEIATSKDAKKDWGPEAVEAVRAWHDLKARQFTSKEIEQIADNYREVAHDLMARFAYADQGGEK